ncbi:hypothetical protein HOY34_14775 [Xinfangfangia sp. D13-10-4-6]|uniref:hypothetical protein n=1 Tax=Pseudogemmobacter hezensis TaxID=2737662 RepID=UPI00155818FD|nr:hypothetical protein [Pseudogemmobacter hezensis]NPD16460.1 hypothetical protein [Pseudogemmobacter hezensis]
MTALRPAGLALLLTALCATASAAEVLHCRLENHQCGTRSECYDPEPDPVVILRHLGDGKLSLTNESGFVTEYQLVRSDPASDHYISTPAETVTLIYYSFLTLDRHGNFAESTHELQRSGETIAEATVSGGSCKAGAA